MQQKRLNLAIFLEVQPFPKMLKEKKEKSINNKNEILRVCERRTRDDKARIDRHFAVHFEAYCVAQ